MMSEKLCVVMPVYNEQDAIGHVLEKWAKALDALGVDYTIRPYNDGSKDRSLAVMKSAAEHLPCVEVHDKKNGGHGHTILTAYRDAVADGYDWIFQVDSDDEMGPEKFGELWANRNSHDFLVGIRDGRVQQLPRKIISFVSRLCVRIFYGKSVWDVNTPYRLMRASAFKAFYWEIPLTTFAPNVILSGLAARHKLRCHEIRVPQHDRTTGEVSIKKWKLFKAAAKSFGQTIAFALGLKGGSKAEVSQFFGQVTSEAKRTPWWMFVGFALVIFAVYGITFTFPSMVYDFASAKGDRLQVFLTYFFMRRYTEGLVSAFFYDFSPIWSNFVEAVFLFASLVVVSVLCKRLQIRRFATFVGLVLWAVTPVLHSRIVGQHCCPSTGIALFVDSIALLLFDELRSSKVVSLAKLALLELCLIFSIGEYQAHVNLLLTAFCAICMMRPQPTARGWLKDMLGIGVVVAGGVAGWFLLSYGPVIAAKAVGVVIPPSGGAHDHIYWFDSGRSLMVVMKSLLADLFITFGYNSLFSLGLRLALLAWIVWLLKSAVDFLRGRRLHGLYMLVFALSVLFHSVMQGSTNELRVHFWFMPFVGFSYMLFCNWALTGGALRKFLMVLVTLMTLESCHETATLYYFRWKVLEHDRLHAGVIATDLWRIYGTKLPKPVAVVGSLGYHPGGWNDMRPFHFMPLVSIPYYRLFSNIASDNVPREFYMFMRELVGFTCTMPDLKTYQNLCSRKALLEKHPVYPLPGYIFEHDEVIVVNLGESKSRWLEFDYADWRSPNEVFLMEKLHLDAFQQGIRNRVFPFVEHISKFIVCD